MRCDGLNAYDIPSYDKLMRMINYLLKKRSKSTNINSLNVGNIDIVDKREISNTMNSYFCSVGDELANKIEDRANPMLTGILCNK